MAKKQTKAKLLNKLLSVNSREEKLYAEKKALEKRLIAIDEELEEIFVKLGQLQEEFEKVE